jgi:hypothetical protein
LSTSSRTSPVETCFQRAANTRSSTLAATRSATSRESCASLISAATMRRLAPRLRALGVCTSSDRAAQRTRRVGLLVHFERLAGARATVAVEDVGLRDDARPSSISACSTRSWISSMPGTLSGVPSGRSGCALPCRPSIVSVTTPAISLAKAGSSSPTAASALVTAASILRASNGTSRPSRLRTRDGT